MATFKGRRKRARLEVRHETGLIDVASRYAHSLQIYTSPPTEELSLNDFERFAAERLKGTDSFHHNNSNLIIFTDVNNLNVNMYKKLI